MRIVAHDVLLAHQYFNDLQLVVVIRHNGNRYMSIVEN